ncbi:MAG: GNAT family N-acetyltransferase [Clostridia bacterium]|nr:GNAT family N-acetyltransferase [Clostridia bacterium]
MIVGCERDVAFYSFIKNMGHGAIYFCFEGGALYRICDENGLLGYMLLKSPSCYLLFEKEPSDEVRDELSHLFEMTGVTEAVSNTELFSRSVPLYVCELDSLCKRECRAEIKTASGKIYDDCHEILSSVGFPLPPRDEFYVISFNRAKDGAPTFYIAEDGKTVATASLIAKNGELALLGAVATLPEYRGKGYAGALVSHAAAFALECGLTPIITYFAENAGRLYRSIGFFEKATLYKKVF